MLIGAMEQFLYSAGFAVLLPFIFFLEQGVLVTLWQRTCRLLVDPCLLRPQEQNCGVKPREFYT